MIQNINLRIETWQGVNKCRNSLKIFFTKINYSVRTIHLVPKGIVIRKITFPVTKVIHLGLLLNYDRPGVCSNAVMQIKQKNAITCDVVDFVTWDCFKDGNSNMPNHVVTLKMTVVEIITITTRAKRRRLMRPRGNILFVPPFPKTKQRW